MAPWIVRALTVTALCLSVAWIPALTPFAVSWHMSLWLAFAVVLWIVSIEDAWTRHLSLVIPVASLGFWSVLTRSFGHVIWPQVVPGALINLIVIGGLAVWLKRGRIRISFGDWAIFLVGAVYLAWTPLYFISWMGGSLIVGTVIARHGPRQVDAVIRMPFLLIAWLSFLIVATVWSGLSWASSSFFVR